MRQDDTFGRLYAVCAIAGRIPLLPLLRALLLVPPSTDRRGQGSARPSSRVGPPSRCEPQPRWGLAALAPKAAPSGAAAGFLRAGASEERERGSGRGFFPAEQMNTVESRVVWSLQVREKLTKDYKNSKTQIWSFYHIDNGFVIILETANISWSF
jgi:hypothetical protein